MGMKNKAAGILKKMLAIFISAKSLNDLRSKLRHLKTRLMIYSLLSRDMKVLFGSVSHKLNNLFITNHHQPNDKTNQNQEVHEEQSNCLHQQLPSPLVVYNDIINVASSPAAVYKEAEDEDQTEEMMSSCVPYQEDEEENQENADNGDNGENDEYPDLRHYEDDEYEMGRPGKVIELVKKAKKGQEFKLEDDIDEVADLFIKRFHRNMFIQKQNSLKRRSGQICN